MAGATLQGLTTTPASRISNSEWGRDGVTVSSGDGTAKRNHAQHDRKVPGADDENKPKGLCNELGCPGSSYERRESHTEFVAGKVIRLNALLSGCRKVVIDFG